MDSELLFYAYFIPCFWVCSDKFTDLLTEVWQSKAPPGHSNLEEGWGRKREEVIREGEGE